MTEYNELTHLCYFKFEVQQWAADMEEDRWGIAIVQNCPTDFITKFKFDITFGDDSNPETTLITTNTAYTDVTLGQVTGVEVFNLEGKSEDETEFAIWLDPNPEYEEEPTGWSYVYETVFA